MKTIIVILNNYYYNYLEILCNLKQQIHEHNMFNYVI